MVGKLIKLCFLTFLVIAGASTSYAQQNSPTIVVKGTSTISIVPDRITVEIGMEDYLNTSDADTIKVTVRYIERMVRRVLHRAGVADSMITVSGIGNYLDKKYSPKFMMAKRLSVVLTSFSQLDEISGNLPDMGVTSFTISKLDNSEMARYNKEGLKAAIDAARSKADFISADVGLGKLIAWKVEEIYPESSGFPVFSNVAFSEGTGMDNMRRIERQYSVIVTYLGSY